MRTESICATAQPAEDNGDVAGEMTTPLRVNGSQYVSGRREQFPEYLLHLRAAGRVDGVPHPPCRRARLVWAVMLFTVQLDFWWAVITLARRYANLDLIMAVGERRIDMIAPVLSDPVEKIVHGLHIRKVLIRD